MSEVISKELELLTTADLRRRYDKTKGKISELENEITLIYMEYRRRQVESEKIVEWMEDIIKETEF
jgi:hypothetical protein